MYSWAFRSGKLVGGMRAVNLKSAIRRARDRGGLGVCVLVTAALGVGCLGAGCSGTVKYLGDRIQAAKDLDSLDKAVRTNFGWNARTRMDRASGTLTLMLPAAAVAKTDSMERYAYALQVARLAKNHYARIFSVKDIAVVFVGARTAGPLLMTDEVYEVRWPVEQLAPDSGPAPGVVPAAPDR